MTPKETEVVIYTIVFFLILLTICLSGIVILVFDTTSKKIFAEIKKINEKIPLIDTKLQQIAKNTDKKKNVTPTQREKTTKKTGKNEELNNNEVNNKK